MQEVNVESFCYFKISGYEELNGQKYWQYEGEDRFYIRGKVFAIGNGSYEIEVRDALLKKKQQYKSHVFRNVARSDILADNEIEVSDGMEVAVKKLLTDQHEMELARSLILQNEGVIHTSVTTNDGGFCYTGTHIGFIPGLFLCLID